MNQRGIELLKHFEGLKLNAYLCFAKVPTIGWGTTRYPDGTQVKMGDTCTEAEAEAYLKHDMKKYENEVLSVLALEPSEDQLAALTCLNYNIGFTQFKKSKTLARYNKGQFLLAAENFKGWRKAGGKIARGLIRRRFSEMDLFIGAVSPIHYKSRDSYYREFYPNWEKEKWY